MRYQLSEQALERHLDSHSHPPGTATPSFCTRPLQTEDSALSPPATDAEGAPPTRRSPQPESGVISVSTTSPRRLRNALLEVLAHVDALEVASQASLVRSMEEHPDGKPGAYGVGGSIPSRGTSKCAALPETTRYSRSA